jgi:hypothetical protein
VVAIARRSLAIVAFISADAVMVVVVVIVVVACGRVRVCVTVFKRWMQPLLCVQRKGQPPQLGGMDRCWRVERYKVVKCVTCICMYIL